MKKIIYFIAALGLSAGFSSCDLDITPDTDVAGPDAGTALYVEGLRNGIYNDMTTMSSYEYMRYPEFYTDTFNETKNSGNRGGFFSRWMLNATDQDVSAIWRNYYSVISSINYTLGKADEAIGADPSCQSKVDIFKGELYFFRAYILHQLALRFCEDYDPSKAATQLGVPVPTSYDPKAKLNRGTLADTYAQILKDITAAESLITDTGSANSVFITQDAITAFKAQVALQMHDYGNASGYAQSLYTSYPLIGSRDKMADMWDKDSSTETIFQFSLTTSTLGVVGNYTYDYTYGSWNTDYSDYVYSPAYIPEQWVCNIFTEDDYRYGTCIGPSYIKDVNDKDGWVLLKFRGNKTLFSSPTSLTYRNQPKLFRVAEMYLIDAEAQYRSNGDALTPLNTLRRARGLADLTGITGDELFKEIQEECVREFIGEGRRLFDLKRWNLGIARDAQEDACSNLLIGGPAIYKMRVEASNKKWVWPIPQQEYQNNSNIGAQNPGY